MNPIDLAVELLGVDWSRRFALVRGLLVAAVFTATPAVAVNGIDWYAQHQAAQLTLTTLR
jgi:hypothetical protein